MGDSLTAGLQNLSLNSTFQETSFPNQLADTVGLEFRQPDVDQRGIAPNIFQKPDATVLSPLWRYAQAAVGIALPSLAMAMGKVPHESLLLPLYNLPSMGRVQTPSPHQNLAVPGFELRQMTDTHNVYDAMGEMLDGTEYRSKLLYYPGYIRGILQENQGAAKGRSMVDRAIAQQPDLVTFWAGANDAIPALGGTLNDMTLTPMESKVWDMSLYNTETGSVDSAQSTTIKKGFEEALTGPEGALTRLLSETQAEVVAVTVPDVPKLPMMRKLGEAVGPLPFRIFLPSGAEVTERIENWVIPNEVRGQGLNARTHFPEGSKITLFTVLGRMAKSGNPITLKGFEKVLKSLEEGQGFSENEVLDPQEEEQVQQRIDQYNELLTSTAEANGRLHLFDFNDWMEGASTEGLPLRGDGPEQRMSDGFVEQLDEQGREGVFCYDGLHISDVGNAMIANEILDIVKDKTQGREGFEAFQSASFIDEKAVLKASRNRDGRNKLFLSPYS